MLLFLSVLLIFFLSTDCRDFDSVVFKELFNSFMTRSKNESELNVMQNLYEINEHIIDFDYQFKSEANDTEFGFKFVEQILIDFITNSVQKILDIVDIRDIFDGAKQGVSSRASCMACHSLIFFLFNKSIPAKILVKVIIGFCSKLNIPNVSTDVCKGFTRMFEPHLDYIRHNTHLKQSEICGLIIGVHCYMKSGTCFKNASPPSDNLCWKLHLNQKNSSVEHKLNSKNNNKIYRILHLTDIHIDTEYVPSSNRNCGTNYCCRTAMTNTSLPEQSSDAGYWGSYFCDPPLHSVEYLFESIDWQSIDLVYWTGDVSSHDSWNDNWNRTLTDSRIISKLLQKYSKGLVIAAIGNHISIPVGTFTPPDISNQLSSKWLYKELAEEWFQWLNSEALSTFLDAGYYVRKIIPGFRIIVVNTNHCARLNVWTLYQSIDPAHHLKWLINQLDEAERIGDFVHIVGHIPIDNRECTQSWAYNYLAIIERYNHIILGQFYGHTHRDEFRFLHSNSDCKKPIGYEVLSPSFSPYDEEFRLNPAYRIISTNYQGRITDIETFTFDLSAANSISSAQPVWYKEYSIVSEYSTDLDVQEFSNFLQTIIRNNYYLQLFYLHYTRSDRNNYCNTDCKAIIINDLNVCNPFESIPKPITSVG